MSDIINEESSKNNVESSNHDSKVGSSNHDDQQDPTAMKHVR